MVSEYYLETWQCPVIKLFTLFCPHLWHIYLLRVLQEPTPCCMSVWFGPFRTQQMTDKKKWILTIISKNMLFMGLLPDTPNYWLRMRGECRERFPRHQLQRKWLVSDPGMHHGTCVTHVPWCMSGSLTRGGGKRYRHSRCMRNLQFCVSGKRPIATKLCMKKLCQVHFREQRLGM